MRGNFNFYKSFSQYKNRKPKITGNYYTNVNTVRRCAVVVGTNPWLEEVPREILKWKLALVDAYIDTSSTTLKLKNISFIEKSEKSAVAFFLGMTFAQVFAQEFLDIRQLYHLDKKGDERFKVDSTGESPDLCGYNKYTNRAFLLEAKGATVVTESTPNYFANDRVKKGCEQLNAVSAVQFTHNNAIYKNHSLNKLVVATHPNSYNDLIHQVVDPTNQNEKTLKINSDFMAFKYYFNIISLLENEKSETYQNKYGDFIILEMKKYNFSVGVLQDIYKLIIPYYNRLYSDKNVEFSTFQGLYNKIDKVLDKLESRISNLSLENDDSFMSIGIDGLIAFSASSIQKDKSS